jgi:catechol 2,3-dioxygenase-like lactoylglutathione lyase family enzyme
VALESATTVMAMTSITSVTLNVADTKAAEEFYSAAFGLGSRLHLRSADAPTGGFRGFTLSLIVSQPSTVSSLIDSAIVAGAATLKPVAKSLWGVGGVVQAPDGAIWKVATSAKKDKGPAAREIDQVVLLLAAEDVGATKKFYVDRGLTVGKSFGSYVEFATGSSPIGLGLYKRSALAKDAGVAPDGTGSHRIVINGDAGAFSDPDGFEWAVAEN